MVVPPRECRERVRAATSPESELPTVTGMTVCVGRMVGKPTVEKAEAGTVTGAASAIENPEVSVGSPTCTAYGPIVGIGEGLS